MLFNSFSFIIFFPIAVVINYLIPQKYRYIWLLICSYYFYMSWNPKYALLLFCVTAVTYVGGFVIDRIKDDKTVCRKSVITTTVLVCLSVLGYFKYYDFFASGMIKAFERIGVEMYIRKADVLLPVGISFYTFQAISYIVDIYRGDVKAEKNFFKYALFVSFFLQLVAGPIERSNNLLKQLDFKYKFDFVSARDGFLMMLWGYYLKLVVADRVAIYVDSVYDNLEEFSGYYVLVATMLFAIQIYCDFAGYSTIAIGGAKILGINLMTNFKMPYLSESISEFWKRWHISLSSWFKDYLYIPLGGNKKGKVRKYLNLMIVFALSGLWHGANITYVIWGIINGLLQVTEDMTSSIREKINNILRLNPFTLCHRMMRVFITFILIDFSWIFFRANNLTQAVNVIQSIFEADNINIFLDGSLYNAGLDSKNWGVLIISVMVIWAVDLVNAKGIYVRNIICNQNYLARWIIIAASVTGILLFGIWGSEYISGNFIYFQF